MVGKDLIMATLLGSGGGSSGSGGGGGGCWPEAPDDGATYLYITLAEGRTSPMLGVGVNGTVTVDWGDGKEPDVLTGTSTGTTVYTQKHAYAAPGDYVIRLTVEGMMDFKGDTSSSNGCRILRYSTGSDDRNIAYRNAIKRIRLGNGIAFGENYSFVYCNSLVSATLPEGCPKITYGMFRECTALATVEIPDSVTKIIDQAFSGCSSLAGVSIPPNVTNISAYTFQNCYALAYVDFTRHNAVPALTTPAPFSNISADCEIRVPAALYDEWIAATNWVTYASYIKAY